MTEKAIRSMKNVALDFLYFDHVHQRDGLLSIHELSANEVARERPPSSTGTTERQRPIAYS